MKVLFTIWAKSRDKKQRQRGTQEHRGTQKTAVFAPEKLDEKNNPNYLLYKIIVVPLRYEN